MRLGMGWLIYVSCGILPAVRLSVATVVFPVFARHPRVPLLAERTRC